jgi:hypothetical protein
MQAMRRSVEIEIPSTVYTGSTQAIYAFIATHAADFCRELGLVSARQGVIPREGDRHLADASPAQPGLSVAASSCEEDAQHANAMTAGPVHGHSARKTSVPKVASNGEAADTSDRGADQGGGVVRNPADSSGCAVSLEAVDGSTVVGLVKDAREEMQLPVLPPIGFCFSFPMAQDGVRRCAVS